jgi:hypothetical protein
MQQPQQQQHGQYAPPPIYAATGNGYAPQQGQQQGYVQQSNTGTSGYAPVPQQMQNFNAPAAIEAPFQLADDPMPCACAAFWCCNLCAGGIAIYLANEANTQATCGRRVFAMAAAERSRFWAKVALGLGVATIIIIVLASLLAPKPRVPFNPYNPNPYTPTP